MSVAERREDAEWNEMYRDRDGYTKVNLFGSDLFGYISQCCDRCGALVQNFTAHEAWHAQATPEVPKHAKARQSQESAQASVDEATR